MFDKVYVYGYMVEEERVVFIFFFLQDGISP